MPLRNMTPGTSVFQGHVLVSLTPLSPRACVRVSKAKWKRGALSRKESKCGLFFTTLHVLKTCIHGCIKHENVFLDLLRMRTDAACSGRRRLRCTEFCAVAPKKSYYVIWLSLLRGKAATAATLHNCLSLVRQHRTQCISVFSFLSMLHPFTSLENLGTRFHA